MRLNTPAYFTLLGKQVCVIYSLLILLKNYFGFKQVLVPKAVECHESGESGPWWEPNQQPLYCKSGTLPLYQCLCYAALFSMFAFIIVSSDKKGYILFDSRYLIKPYRLYRFAVSDKEFLQI